MSDEQQLQNEAADTVVDNVPAEIENQNNGAELATASDEQHEEKAQPKVEDDAEVKAKAAQEATQRVINEKVFKAKQAERERDELQQKLNAIEKEKQDKLADSFSEMPNLPVYPTDAFDDNYEADVNKYNQEMGNYQQRVQEKANFDAQQNFLQQQQQQQQQVAAQQQQQENQKVVIEHNARAKELGISESEMFAAESTVLSYGINPDCLMHIVNSGDSPLIIKHLAANPEDGLKLANMSNFAVDAFINGIRTKTEELKPRKSVTPAPVDNLSGKGAQKDLNKFPNSKGAKFS